MRTLPQESRFIQLLRDRWFWITFLVIALLVCSMTMNLAFEAGHASDTWELFGFLLMTALWIGATILPLFLKRLTLHQKLWLMMSLSFIAFMMAAAVSEPRENPLQLLLLPVYNIHEWIGEYIAVFVFYLSYKEQEIVGGIVTALIVMWIVCTIIFAPIMKAAVLKYIFFALLILSVLYTTLLAVMMFNFSLFM